MPYLVNKDTWLKGSVCCMLIQKKNGWVWYYDEEYYAIAMDYLEYLKEKYPDRKRFDVFDEDGKWMIFCGSYEHAERLCSLVVESKCVNMAKHTMNFSKTGTGVCCLYSFASDISNHKKLISVLKENDLLQRNKDGSFRNIAFKSNYDTQMGIYGELFEGELHLGDIIDLKTGEWTNKVYEYERLALEYERKSRIMKIIEELACEYFGDDLTATSHFIKKGDHINLSLVKERIKEQNKTAKDIAYELDVTEPTVRAWLNGKRQPPARKAIALGYYLDIDLPSIIIKGDMDGKQKSEEGAD